MFEDLREELEKGANAISKRIVNSAVNGGCNVLVTLLEVVILIVIPISITVVFTNFTFAQKRT